mmetsp:Transcript_84566/g.182299  ORF Transcript_84566/g.182299 Transcript_84566/m.182299 type:complete len:431 (-) Transcript_84566:84-1376(-)
MLLRHGLWAAPLLRGQQHLGEFDKEPIYGYTTPAPEDEASAQDRLLVDSFLVLYWGGVIAFVLFMNYVVVPIVWAEEEEEEDPEEEDHKQETLVARTTTEMFASLDKNKDGKISLSEWKQASRQAAEDGAEDIFQGTGKQVAEPKEVELPGNMWTLNLVSAISQAKIGKHFVNGYLTCFLTLGMASLQIFALFLVVHDINPDATPVTTVPKDSWIEGGWSVNTMKWLMVTFMSLLMVTEAGECRTLLTCILETNSHRLLLPRWFLFIVCSFQYIIMLIVIWGGVAAVLSFQSVPDILYSSMSITYIAKVDEAFFVMLVQLLDIQADFLVIHGRKVAKMEAQDMFKAIDKDGDGDVSKEELREFQENLFEMVHDPKLRPEKLGHPSSVALHCLAAFPVFLGFALIGRAMTTNVMPTDRFHDIKNFLIGLTQ